MKILHENGKIFGKISAVDILVVCLVILLLGGVYSKYKNDIIPKANTSVTNSTAKEFYFDLEIKNVIQETGTMIKIGDKVYDKISGTEIGEITKVTTKPAKIDFSTIDGKIIQSEIQEKIDIDITVKSLGTIKDGKYLANYTIDILAGETRQFETKFVTVSSKVLNVYVMEE